MGHHLSVCIGSNVTDKNSITLITWVFIKIVISECQKIFWIALMILTIILIFCPCVAVAGCEFESMECLQQNGSYVSGEFAFRSKEPNYILLTNITLIY